tara:strand:+ start:574 stop:726 length:153 start_codon:yes stop_codon:yes gene_type:complete
MNKKKVLVKALITPSVIIMTKFYTWIICYALNKGLDSDKPRNLTKVTQTY